MKYNANEEIGNKYFKEYKCQGVPHLLFLDSMGNEVDRIIGFLPPTEYLLRIKDIAQKRNTLNDYLLRYEKGEKNAEVIAAIAMKYEDRNENDNAALYYSMLINEYPDENSEYYVQGEFFLASHEFKKGNENALKNFIKNNPDSKFRLSAYRKMTFHFADTQQMNKELLIYKEMIENYSEDPGVLNSYAWRMAEIENNLEDALLKINQAISLTMNDNRQANILDTKAEVLWKMSRYDEAIKVIEKAIFMEPKNDYFKEQKTKFLESKNSKVSHPA